jgi:hypothetical protein
MAGASAAISSRERGKGRVAEPTSLDWVLGLTTDEGLFQAVAGHDDPNWRTHTR